MLTILVVGELKNGQIRKSTLEVVSAAAKMAETTSARVVALLISAVAADTTPLARCGADQVLIARADELAYYHPDYYKQAVLYAVERTGAGLVLFSASNTGKDLAPRVAGGLNSAYMSDCTEVEFHGEQVLVRKPLFAGKVLGRFLLSGEIKCVSIRPGVLEVVSLRPDAASVEEAIGVPLPLPRIRLLRSGTSTAAKLDVADAEIIVTGGRGLRAAENFTLLEELANSLGAAVGATRAVVDSGWRPHSEQVGQTGKVVSPKLYWIIGASGSIQHWAGMSGSRCIVAVNKDGNAPILQRADYSIVGDLFEVIPALTAEIKKLSGQ